MNPEEKKSLRVMMVGPGEGIIGGINTLVDTIVPHVQERVDLDYFTTVTNRPLKRSGILSLQNLIIAFSQFSRFRPEIRKFQPQILHVHTSQGIAWLKDSMYLWVGRHFHAKVIIHIHAADIGELYSRQPRWMKAYTRFTLSKADAVIAVSEIWKKSLEAILPTQHIYAFRNCIEASEEPIQQIQNRDGIHGLFVGSIGPRKGAFDIIEAVNITKSNGNPIHIWLAGYEERPGDMTLAQKRISELNVSDRVELVGVIKGEVKANYFEKMDYFLLPSHNEGLPMAILEAMAKGRAVISTPVGGIPEVVIDNYNGFLIPPGDITNLAKRIEKLTGDAVLCNSMGVNSLHIVREKLSVNSYVERLVQLYDDLANKTTDERQ